MITAASVAVTQRVPAPARLQPRCTEDAVGSILLLALTSADPALTSSEPFDCTTVVTEGYDGILTRDPGAEEQSDVLHRAKTETPWPAASGPMAGEPWSPAGMVSDGRARAGVGRAV